MVLFCSVHSLSSVRFCFSLFHPPLRVGVEPLFIEPKERGSLLLRMWSRATPVGWPVGAAGKAQLPWFLIIKGRGASSLGRARGKREMQQN